MLEVEYRQLVFLQSEEPHPLQMMSTVSIPQKQSLSGQHGTDAAIA